MINRVSNLQQTQIAQIRNQQTKNQTMPSKSISFGSISRRIGFVSNLFDGINIMDCASRFIDADWLKRGQAYRENSDIIELLNKVTNHKFQPNVVVEKIGKNIIRISQGRKLQDLNTKEVMDFTEEYQVIKTNENRHLFKRLSKVVNSREAELKKSKSISV